MKLPRFDGHGNSNEKREPDGSKKEAHNLIHSGKTLAQVARELGCSEYSLNLWKKAYLRQQAPAEIDGQQRSPEQMFAEIRRLQKENEYLKRQREILSLVLSTVEAGLC